MADTPMSKELEFGLASTIQVTKMQTKEEPKDNFKLGSGDGYRKVLKKPLKKNSKQAPTEPDTSQLSSMEDLDNLEFKRSNTSIFSCEELEQRMNFRLEKLAEFENAQNQMADNTNEDGVEVKENPQTWQEFWKNVEQSSEKSSNC